LFKVFKFLFRKSCLHQGSQWNAFMEVQGFHNMQQLPPQQNDTLTLVRFSKVLPETFGALLGSSLYGTD
jgi:hypothetical protein